ncbi:MAG: prolyl oligopeptidase family serine peptidase [Rubrivivax sp.]
MHVLRWLLVPLLLIAGLAAGRAQTAPPGPRAPEAARQPFVVKGPHGERRDDYHWLRDDDPRSKRAEVLRHLEAENRHTEAVLAPLKGLRERLAQEMTSRVKGDDSTLPVYDRGWWIWRQFESGVEHPRLMRRRGTPDGPDPAARPEVLLDLPQQAIAQRYYALGRVELSPDGQWLAWTEDVVGRSAFDLYIQNLRTRRLQPERIRGVLENFVWAADSKTLFYVRQDAGNLHSGSVWRHERGADPAADRLVHEEPDKTLFVELRASASRRQVLIDVHGTDTAELLAVPAAAPDTPAQVVFARRPGVRVHADHIGERWVLRTNEDAPNFRLVEAPEKSPEKRESWRTLVPARDDVAIEGIELFEQALAIEERVAARRRVRVLGWDGRTLRVVDGGEASSASLGENRDAAAQQVQVLVQSLIKPPATLDVHLASGRETLRRQESLRGVDPALYRTQQIMSTARDGARVPVTLAWRADRARADGQAPLLIEAYGAYGISYDLEFGAHRLSLLDRGFVIAIAHVRGGGELGQAWYEAGRLQNKHHSFEDFVDVTDDLLARRWGHAEKVFAQGASAGGLLLAVVANEAGGRYRGLALDVPFVDVVTSLLDSSIPLTANEWGQWGDPRRKADHDYLLAYSPYDNIAAREYPAMLVTTALWDTLVPFHEPAKYVARLRATKTDRNPLLLHVEMDAGHGGAAGRFERPRHWARQYAFFLDLAGLASVAPAPGSLATPQQPEATRAIKLTR